MFFESPYDLLIGSLAATTPIPNDPVDCLFWQMKPSDSGGFLVSQWWSVLAGI